MDNAFERARAAYGSGAYDDATLEFLFPQLKESEDERIRKAILGLTYLDGIEPILTKCSITAGDIRTYLEKQKERKPVEGDNETEIQKAFREGKSAGRQEVFDHPEEYGLQKEQKPDDDPLNDPKFLNGFDTGREVQRIFDEKKPAEWSEEDADILNCCISSIEEAKENRYAYKETDGDTSYDHEIDWLKSLRPSWKPSEEELVALKRVGSILRDYGYGELAKTVFMIEGKLANLDVLNKPMWKPNEEQMKALNALNLYGNLSYVGQQNQLISLYQDLKKLM